MQRLAILARALAGAGALAMATVTPALAQAQDEPIPRAHGYAAIDALPDWSGVWAPDWSLLFGGGAAGPPAQPKLTPAAQQRLDAFRAKQAAEGVDQYAQAHCIPPGMPGIMRQPYPIEFVFSPQRVTLFAETYSQARRIYTDGRPIPEDPDPYFNGNSVGHWEGDTLLVDTVGFSPAAAEIGAGIPHGGNMKIHERIWLEKPGVMRIETTITDPDVLTEPFVSQLAFKREPDWEIREYVCEENNRLTSGDAGGSNIDLGIDAPADDPFGQPREDEPAAN
ncbi:MAG: hypothetical protein ABIT16_04765 [Croceibacterium sp.]